MITIRGYILKKKQRLQRRRRKILKKSKEGAKNLKQTFFSIITGVASANYLTPVVIETANINNMNYSNGIAFILGFIGLKGVESISKRMFKEKENDSTNN